MTGESVDFSGVTCSYQPLVSLSHQNCSEKLDIPVIGQIRRRYGLYSGVTHLDERIPIAGDTHVGDFYSTATGHGWEISSVWGSDLEVAIFIPSTMFGTIHDSGSTWPPRTIIQSMTSDLCVETREIFVRELSAEWNMFRCETVL